MFFQLAMARFYENDGEADEPQQIPLNQERTETEPEVMVSPPTQPSSKPKPRSKNTNARFATVHTLNNSSDDDEEEGQAFYAGGSETSGQQVLGPPRKNIVADIFKSVQE